MSPEGVIIGGWNYVIAAYTITVVGLGIFAWSLRSRRKKVRDESETQE